MKINYDWNRDLYNSYLERLVNNSDSKTKEFNSKIINTKYEILGLKTPIMNSIAKDISKTNITTFLDLCGNKYFEEVMIEGFVISYIKDYETFLKYFNRFILKIDNWALCDQCISRFKLFKEEDFSSKASSLIYSNNEFLSRVGYIIYLDYYIDDDHVDDIINLSLIPSDYYYVNMAISWLLATAYIKYRSNILELIKSGNLPVFVQNMTIQKIRDSKVISKEEKEMLKQYKKK